MERERRGVGRDEVQEEGAWRDGGRSVGVKGGVEDGVREIG